ncbi:MAG: DUF86 domain-containing protein [Spirochaetes bacterium]|nr:MAG: DUF86 domain-containing protein [Spirochaetota bacterium]
MNMDKERIKQFLLIIRENNRKLKELKDAGKDTFLKDYKYNNTALRLLQISIESMVNICNHIISRNGLRRPKDFSDSIAVLEENGIFSKDSSQRYQRMIQFRNRIVHLYWDIDLDYVYDLLTTNLKDFDLFIKEIIRYLQ